MAGREADPLIILFVSRKPRLQKPCGGQALRRRQEQGASLFTSSIGEEAGLPPPSSHTTWHTVPYQGGSCQATLLVPYCLSSYRRPALPRGFRPLLPALRPSCEASAKEDQKCGSCLADRFGPLSGGYPTLTASADFCQPIPSLFNDGSTWQAGRSPRVRRATFIPYTRRIYFYISRVIIGLWIFCLLAQM